MSVTPSISSARSLLSPSGIRNEQNQRTPGISPSVYSFSKSLPSAKLPNEGFSLNPDELFTKYTVSEVRAVQHRLRADADAKQEELRLMVGERYRDLLQASSSIISIAQSSRHVCEALEECRDALISQNDLPLPPVTTTENNVNDRHLYTLQVLSAHMKILLDAPEHLWRLIERKKYLPAAWLFLLARVVYQALRNDDTDEQSWINEGIDVLAEFPLVQRQWEVVSQFRSQIIHKSTLSLREASISTEDTCAILVTLHLLDSRPLNETLAALLSQRSKTLQSILAWNSDGGTPINNNLSHISNGNTTERKSVAAVTSVPVREMTQIVKKALNVISQSVCTARSIFLHEASDPSLIGRVLESIQTDSSRPDKSLPRLPDLSTESLLANLTSSANFQLLPSVIRSYKPFVDLNSSSTFMAQPQFFQKVQTWFQQSSNLWQTCAGGWLTGLQTVKEVWTLRSSIRRWIMTSGLKEEEIIHLLSTTDSLCHDRIVRIWTQALTGAEALFKTRLNSYVSEPRIDISPLDFLFQSPSAPIFPQTVKSFGDTPFQKYQLTLKRQLIGRSVQLDDILSALEHCARTIQHDFSIVKAGIGGDEKTKSFVNNQLTQAYQPSADTLSTNVISIIDKVVSDVTDNQTGSSASGLVFLSRVTEDLASASLFVENIACSHHAGQEFNSKLALLNAKIIYKWRETIVAQMIRDGHFLRGKHRSQSAAPAGPSPQLVQSLLSLSDSTSRLGFARHPVRQKAVVQDTLRLLITSWIDEGWEVYDNQALHDLAFLRKIADVYGSEWEDISILLADKLKANASDSTDHEYIDSCASEYLARSQILFSGLLPSLSKTASESQLLQFGVPSTSQTYHSALDLAKPSPRFGMLLVGNTDR